MLYVALALIVVIIGLLLAGYRERRDHDEAVLEILNQAAAERSALIDKIQHPEIVPAPTAKPVNSEARMALLERHREHLEELGKVGQVAVRDAD